MGTPDTDESTAQSLEDVTAIVKNQTAELDRQREALDNMARTVADLQTQNAQLTRAKDDVVANVLTLCRILGRLV